jgi:catechol 2,3-dioxygenase-like lactoylglutathione lyase family enzyme
MAKTTRVLSVSVPVADLDAALRFYVGVLGCELRYDGEAWPGARMAEVVPPGSQVGLVLLPRDTPLPIAVRIGTTDADEAYARVAAAEGVEMRNTEVLRWEGVPAMFHFTDVLRCTAGGSLAGLGVGHSACRSWRLVAARSDLSYFCGVEDHAVGVL